MQLISPSRMRTCEKIRPLKSYLRRQDEKKKQTKTNKSAATSNEQTIYQEKIIAAMAELANVTILIFVS